MLQLHIAITLTNYIYITTNNTQPQTTTAAPVIHTQTPPPTVQIFLKLFFKYMLEITRN